MKTSGYSLWLTPQKDVKKIYQRIIGNLSKKYHTPYFEPHVTLLGSISGDQTSVIDKTKQLLTFLKPIAAGGLKINFEDFYFRSIYLKLHKSPALKDFNLKAKKIFGFAQTSDYMPHLSLIYADLPIETKLREIQMLPEITNKEFKLEWLDLYYCEGEVRDWKLIKRYSLG